MKIANHRFTRQKHNHQIVEVEKPVFEPKAPVYVSQGKVQKARDLPKCLHEKTKDHILDTLLWIGVAWAIAGITGALGLNEVCHFFIWFGVGLAIGGVVFSSMLEYLERKWDEQMDQ